MDDDTKTNGFMLFNMHDSMHFMVSNVTSQSLTVFLLQKHLSLHCFHVLSSEYNIHVGFKNGFTYNLDSPDSAYSTKSLN